MPPLSMSRTPLSDSGAIDGVLMLRGVKSQDFSKVPAKDTAGPGRPEWLNWLGEVSR